MAADAGGLHALFSMALGGLVGTTPHMIAASVMALARLLFEFAGRTSHGARHGLSSGVSLLRWSACRLKTTTQRLLKNLNLSWQLPNKNSRAP